MSSSPGGATTVDSGTEPETTTPLVGDLGRRTFRQDPLSVGIQWLALLFNALFALMALTEQRESQTAAEHFGLLLFVLTGMMLLAVANDLIVLFMAFEMVGMGTCLLVFLSEPRWFRAVVVRGDAPLPAATNFLLINMFASAVLLFGFSILYGSTGTTILDSFPVALSISPSASDAHGIGVGLATTFSGGLGIHLRRDWGQVRSGGIPFRIIRPCGVDAVDPWIHYRHAANKRIRCIDPCPVSQHA